MSHLMTVEEQKMFEAGKKFYRDNSMSQRIFYRPLNDLIPFLFNKKIDEFHDKVEFYLEKSKEISKNFFHRIAYAYATGNYNENQFCHYYFNIDGKIEVFGILELEMHGILEASKIISLELKEKQKKSIPDNVIQFQRSQTV